MGGLDVMTFEDAVKVFKENDACENTLQRVPATALNEAEPDTNFPTP